MPGLGPGIGLRTAGMSAGRFGRVYTRADIVLLAEADRLCGQMSGKAMGHVLRRQSEVFGEAAFGRLAGISPSHIHNLRCSRTLRSKRTTLEKMGPSPSAISERRPPEPRGEPGHVRVTSCTRATLTAPRACTWSTWWTARRNTSASARDELFRHVFKGRAA